jgi:DNA-binding response OmpR family regulator
MTPIAKRPMAEEGPPRVLVIEDNANLAFGLRNNLEIEGYVVDHAPPAPKASRAPRPASPT